MRFLRRKALSVVESEAAGEEGKALRADDNDVEGDGTQSSPATQFQCKPDISCWNFLPNTLTEKWSKLRRSSVFPVIIIWAL